MAEVFPYVNGEKLERLIARHKDAQAGVAQHTRARAAKAAAILHAGRYSEGKSQILIEQGEIDWFVILDDSNDLNAAVTIEFGRKKGKFGAMKPVAPLRKAFPEIGGE